MLDRIGSLSFSQGMIGEYGRIQARTVKWQTQIATGKVGDNLSDVKDKASVLLAAKQKSADVKSYISATKDVLTRLDVQDLHLQQMTDISGQLRTTITDALSSGRTTTLMSEVRNLYNQAVAILNFRIDGKYIYGGSRTDVPPVVATDLNSLQGLADVADAFQNNEFEVAQRIDESETITVGIPGSAMAQDLFKIFKDVADFDAGTSGPFTGRLDNVQSSFLSAQTALLPGVHNGLADLAALNGSRHEQVRNAQARHETMANYFEKFIGDIEDVNLAEAIARLNQDQVAAEAAGRMIAQMNKLSLLEFI